MNQVPEKYRARLTANANDFDQIVIDILKEACEAKLEAERWRLQHKDVLANCNDVALSFKAYRETSNKVISNLNAELRGEWINLDEFLKSPTEGLCWIVYKTRVTSAYCHHNGAFSFSAASLNRYDTDCITKVIPINKPTKPNTNKLPKDYRVTDETR